MPSDGSTPGGADPGAANPLAPAALAAQAALRHRNDPMGGDPAPGHSQNEPVPTPLPGEIVVLDVVSSHRVAGVKVAIEAAGARVLRLPPYSPDLNPIEPVFTKSKAILRRTAARTKDGLRAAIGTALAAFTPQERTNYVTNSAYSN